MNRPIRLVHPIRRLAPLALAGVGALFVQGCSSSSDSMPDAAGSGPPSGDDTPMTTPSPGESMVPSTVDPDAMAPGSETGGDETGTPPEGQAPVPGATGGATSIGFVELETPAGLTGALFTTLDASFVSFPEGLADAARTDLTLDGATLDSCSFDAFDIGDVLDTFETEVTFLDAGEVLPLSSSAGSYVDLMRVTEFGFTFYEPDVDPLPVPIPDDLVISVGGGAGFPAFGDVPFPEVEPLVVGDDSAFEFEGAGTTFRWEAGSDPEARITIALVDSSGLGFTLGSEDDDEDDIERVDCIASDDGEFTLPADIVARLPADFDGRSFVTRTKVTVRRIDGVLLAVRRSSSAR